MPAPPPTAQRSRPLAIAILLTLAAGALYTFGYALAKLLAETLDPVQITFLRSLLVLGAALLVLPLSPAPAATLRRLFVPPRAVVQRGAAAMLVLSTTLAVLGYALVPVTEASALGFTAPLLLVILGRLILSEAVDGRRWLAILLGFAGTLLIIRPGGELFSWVALVPIAAALTYAIYQVLLRHARTIATEGDALRQSALMGVILLAPLMPLLWRPPDGAAVALLVLYTAVQTAALGCLAGALRRVEVSRLAPWHYARILFALGCDAALFARLPDGLSLVGCAGIAVGGLIIAFPKRAEATSAPPPFQR